MDLEHRFNYGEAAVKFTPDFNSLPQNLREMMEPQLVEAAGSGFKRSITPEFSQDVAQHVRGGDLFVIEQDDSFSGFAMLEQFPKEGVIYIAGIVKKPTAPSGIIEAIVRHHLDQTQAGILTVRTQNDRVLEILANTCEQVVALDRTSKPEEVDLLLRLGLFKSDSDLDVDYLIHRGYYGSPMIQNETRRRSVNPRVTGLTERLKYFDGDAAYGIGYRK